ncbi:hypothetical protein BDZ91DRAFT_741867 [Kalaharituber pfeilii]|nr:hypothetical protein BDZ91DRAFT_741867 [Kalaharituber pfeilii]
MPATIATLFAALLLLAPTTAFAQAPLTKEQKITDALLACAKDGSSGHSCGTFYNVDTCITETSPSFWDLFDQHHGASNVSSTPLAPELSKIRTCVCDEKTLSALTECIACVREQSGFQDEKEAVDVYGVGWVAQTACAVELDGFGLGKPQELRVEQKDLETKDDHNDEVFSGRNETNSSVPAPSGVPAPSSTATPSTGRNESVPTSPTPSNSAPSESESDSAAGTFVEHVLPSVGMGVVVAALMAML